MSHQRYRDNCDRCLTETSEPIPPTTVTPSGPGSVLATYRCPDCGGTWTCSWAAQPDEDAAA